MSGDILFSPSKSLPKMEERDIIAELSKIHEHVVQCTFKNKRFTGWTSGIFQNTEITFEDCHFEDCLLNLENSQNFAFVRCEFWSKNSSSIFQLKPNGNGGFQQCKFQGKGCLIKCESWGSFNHCEFSDIPQLEIILRNPNGANFSVCQFDGCTFVGKETVFKCVNSEICNAIFQANSTSLDSMHSTYESCKFNQTELINFKVNEKTIFKKCDFSEAIIHSTTFVKPATFYGCKFTKVGLMSFENENAPSLQDKIRMEIIDDIAHLRLSFSGYWQYVHVLAFTAFVFPYIFFVIIKVLKASIIGGHVEGIPLYQALGEFIKSGGKMDGNIDSIACLLFIVGISYNAIRLILLYKTKNLEARQECRGIPDNFILSDKIWIKNYQTNITWTQLTSIYKTMFMINLLAVICHSIKFLGYHVPQ